MLILSRSGQGVGGAIMFATSLALLGQSFQGKDRGVAFGVWGAITGVAVSLGPILGGVITTYISWRAIFLVNVPIGVVAVAITWWRVDESVPPPRTAGLDGVWPADGGADQRCVRPDQGGRNKLGRCRRPDLPGTGRDPVGRLRHR